LGKLILESLGEGNNEVDSTIKQYRFNLRQVFLVRRMAIIFVIFVLTGMFSVKDEEGDCSKFICVCC